MGEAATDLTLLKSVIKVINGSVSYTYRYTHTHTHTHTHAHSLNICKSLFLKAYFLDQCLMNIVAQF